MAFLPGASARRGFVQPTPRGPLVTISRWPRHFIPCPSINQVALYATSAPPSPSAMGDNVLNPAQLDASLSMWRAIGGALMRRCIHLAHRLPKKRVSGYQ